MLLLLDCADTMGMEECAVDFAVFDQLTVGQRISTPGKQTSH